MKEKSRDNQKALMLWATADDQNANLKNYEESLILIYPPALLRQSWDHIFSWKIEIE